MNRGADRDPGLQRHHLLPRQLLSQRAFARMFAILGERHRRFDDFRQNGLLLPCQESAAIRLGLPLHRGPHRRYSELVIARVGQIEAGWAESRPRGDGAARSHAHMRLGLLQRALRRSLLGSRRRLRLHRGDPLAAGDYSDLDAMAEALWGATAP